jgi:hypothetical protein
VLEWTRAQVATMKPDLHSRAVANLIKDLINTSDGVTHMVDKFWGLSQRYDLSSGNSEQDLHPLVGRSVPDFELISGSGRLGERLRSGHGLLITFNAEDQTALASLADQWSDTVDVVVDRATDELGMRVILVRPDGIVAWATEGKPDLDALRAAFSRWFGKGSTLRA